MKALQLCSEGFSLFCFIVAFLVEYIAEECGLLLCLDFCDCRSLNCLTISGMDKSGILFEKKKTAVVAIQLHHFPPNNHFVLLKNNKEKL